MNLRNIFKRKVGGTMLGNLVRGAVKAVPFVGGMLGNGAMSITQEQVDRRDLSTDDYAIKYSTPQKPFDNGGGQMKEIFGSVAAAAAMGIPQTPTVNADGNVYSGALKVAQNGKNLALTVGIFVVGLIVLIFGIKFISKK